MPGAPDWGGQSLVHGIDILADGFGVFMAAGQTISFPAFEITRPGYLLNVGVVYDSVSGSTPLCVLDMGWYDSTQSTHLGHEMWEMAVGTPGNGFFHVGRGPTKGQLLVMSFTNVDSVQAMDATFWLAQTTQHASRDDIRVHLDGVSPVWSPNANDFAPENELAAILNMSIPTGGVQTMLLPLYSGQASLFWSCTGQSAANEVSVTILPASGAGTQPPVYKGFASATPFASQPGQLIALPRRVCLLEIGNTGAATATLSLSLVALEYSS